MTSAPHTHYCPAETDIPQALFSPLDFTLFEAFLRHGLSRDRLAQAVNDPHLHTLEVVAWLNQPHIAQARAAVRELATESAAICLAISQVEAINTLARQIATNPDPTQQRLAATTLFRAAHPRSAPRLIPRAAHPEEAAKAPSTNERSSTPSTDEPSSATSETARTLPQSDQPFSTPLGIAPTLPQSDEAASSPPQAEGLEASSRGSSDRQRRSSDTPGPAAPTTPYPEGVPGAPSTNGSPAVPSTPLTLSLTHPLQSPSSPSPSSSASSAPSALKLRLSDLDDATDEDDEELTPQDHEEGEHAFQFFKNLSVPLSHPDIIHAIAEHRGHELEPIAAGIRAALPRAP